MSPSPPSELEIMQQNISEFDLDLPYVCRNRPLSRPNKLHKRTAGQGAVSGSVSNKPNPSGGNATCEFPNSQGNCTRILIAIWQLINPCPHNLVTYRASIARLFARLFAACHSTYCTLSQYLICQQLHTALEFVAAIASLASC